MSTRSQAHLIRTGRPTSGGLTPSSPPITATGPTTALGTAAGAVGRVIATLTASGGTPPYVWTVANAGGMSVNIVGAQLRTTADPAGSVGTHNVDLVCTDSRSQTRPLTCVVTLT